MAKVQALPGKSLCTWSVHSCSPRTRAQGKGKQRSEARRPRLLVTEGLGAKRLSLQVKAFIT